MGTDRKSREDNTRKEEKEEIDKTEWINKENTDKEDREGKNRKEENNERRKC